MVERLQRETITVRMMRMDVRYDQRACGGTEKVGGSVHLIHKQM